MPFLFAVNRVLTDVPFSHLLRDPNQVTDSSSLTGALSTVGLVGWTAAAVLLFTAAWLRGRRGLDGRPTFLAVTGLLAMAAFVDDAYLLHERAFVGVTGGHEFVWYAVYVSIVGVWLVAFRAELRRAPVELLIAAVALAASQALDVAPGRYVLWEESLKLVGIGWFVAFAAREVASAAPVPASPGSAVRHPAVGGDGCAVDHP